jgi:hypothetical protein
LVININNPTTFLEKGEFPPKKTKAETKFIIIILAYSPIKNNAKGAPAYSTLYPETNSDSPSVKSNGARLVSAKVEIYHITNKGKQGSASQKFFCGSLKALNPHLPINKIKGNTIKVKLTSYDTV